MDPVTVVEAVKGSPAPLVPVYQPPKTYPVRVGGAGRVTMVVAGLATVIEAGLAAVLPPLLLNVTV
jgi:hypothetical protein